MFEAAGFGGHFPAGSQTQVTFVSGTASTSTAIILKLPHRHPCYSRSIQQLSNSPPSRLASLTDTTPTSKYSCSVSRYMSCDAGEKGLHRVVPEVKYLLQFLR